MRQEEKEKGKIRAWVAWFGPWWGIFEQTWGCSRKSSKDDCNLVARSCRKALRDKLYMSSDTCASFAFTLSGKWAGWRYKARSKLCYWVLLRMRAWSNMHRDMWGKQVAGSQHVCGKQRTCSWDMPNSHMNAGRSHSSTGRIHVLSLIWISKGRICHSLCTGILINELLHLVLCDVLREGCGTHSGTRLPPRFSHHRHRQEQTASNRDKQSIATLGLTELSTASPLPAASMFSVCCLGLDFWWMYAMKWLFQ